MTYGDFMQNLLFKLLAFRNNNYNKKKYFIIFILSSLLKIDIKILKSVNLWYPYFNFQFQPSVKIFC
jgi:hypothetical protein